MGVMLSSSTPGQMERRRGAWREDHWRRGHPEHQKLLEPLMTRAVTRGDLSDFSACGTPVAGTYIKQRLCSVVGG